jgi:ABC-2 type transport system ATP-binding protein
MDCQKDGVAIRSRVGYLPGELSLYPSMTARGFLDMVSAVGGGGVDPKYRQSLCDRLQLDTGRRMQEYSRGNKQKVGIVSAFMRRPDLLILDEPTSGLDPLVQAAVLDLVREAKAEGRTVFFSSHIISEVQAVCDRVGIIREGRLAATESVETLTHQQFRRLTITFDGPPPELDLAGVTETSRNDRSVTLEIRTNLNSVLEKAASHGVIDLETIPVSLEEVFRAYYGGGQGGRNG